MTTKQSTFAAQRDRRLSQLVLGLVLSFIMLLIGNEVPRFMERYLPFDHYVDIQSIVAEDVYQGQTKQSITFVRDVNGDAYNASVIQELMLVEVGGEPGEEVFSFSDERIIEHKETDTAKLRVPLPSDLPPGSYYWVLSYTISLNDAIRKEAVFNSNIFTVKPLTDVVEENDLIDEIEVSDEAVVEPTATSTE